MKYEKIFAAILGLTTITIIVFAITVPMQGLRKKQLDAQTVAALPEVEIAVSKYMVKNGEKVPTDTSKLEFTDYDSVQSNKSVLKRITIKEKDGSYQLCGTFYTSTKKEVKVDTEINATDLLKTSLMGANAYGNQYGNHSKGVYCYDSTSSYYYDTPNIMSGSATYNSGSSAGGVSSQTATVVGAKDTERKTDINALQSQLEVYFANTGYYPLLSEINSASWRATNMKGLSTDSLKDPAGSSQTLVDKPAANVYSYQVFDSYGKACTKATDCVDYTLTTTLDTAVNGQKTYVKQALGY